MIPVKYKIENAVDLFIEYRGEDSWAVTYHGMCLNRKELCFEYEPSPSNRTEVFLKECRFDNASSAELFWNINRKSIKGYAGDLIPFHLGLCVGGTMEQPHWTFDTPRRISATGLEEAKRIYAHSTGLDSKPDWNPDKLTYWGYRIMTYDEFNEFNRNRS